MRTPRRFIAVAALYALCLAEPGLGATSEGSLVGEITIVKNGKPVSEHGSVVVYIEGVPLTSKAKRKLSIKQKDVQFSPRVSVAVKGTTVDFPNEDRVFHNVFSTSRPARFDLGLYRAGTSKSVELKREGVIDIFCNIHPEMSSRVLVVPTRHFATTDAKGAFRIDGVPAGTYNVVVWHPNGTEARQSIKIDPSKATSMKASVDEGDKPKAHRRKDGSLYGRYE
jgi:plastocyanin